MALAELKQAGHVGLRQVLVTEVTRMKNGIVCVAGLDIATGAMVRPLMDDGSNWPEADWVDTDYLRVGNIVALEPAAQMAGALPHANEDYRVASVAKIGVATPEQLFDACVETADADLNALFNGELFESKYVDAGAACRSLGCLIVDEADVSVSSAFEKVSLVYDDDEGIRHYLKVTELQTSKAGIALIAAPVLAARIKGRGRMALRLGLTRPWPGVHGEFDPPRCTLQLNGIIVAP